VTAQTPEARAQAENQLTGALRQLFALAESYPDLKANESFRDLQGSLGRSRRRSRARAATTTPSSATSTRRSTAFLPTRSRCSSASSSDSTSSSTARKSVKFRASPSGAERIGRLAALFLALALVPATTFGAPAPTRGQFAIDSFVTSVVVNPDGSLLVREDITFSFRGSHQGIFRRIPAHYTRDGSSTPWP